MGARDYFDYAALDAQVARQRKHAWNIDTDIPWNDGIEFSKLFVPLDSDAIAFPGASSEQRLVLSQLMGLILNSTIAQLEDVINDLRMPAWGQWLKKFPVGPEFKELGELFFEEEAKHASAFNRYEAIFCNSLKLDPKLLELLLPKAVGSLQLKAIAENARLGGHAFWWIVSAVEEVSLAVYHDLHDHREILDPLFCTIHRRHMEEEARHHNYAFLMLDLLQQCPRGIWRPFLNKADLVFAQTTLSSWILSELRNIFQSKYLTKEHPWLKTIAESLPLFDSIPWTELAVKMLAQAPYISLVINTRNHPLTLSAAKKHGVYSLPFPQPKKFQLAA